MCQSKILRAHCALQNKLLLNLKLIKQRLVNMRAAFGNAQQLSSRRTIARNALEFMREVRIQRIVGKLLKRGHL